MAEKNDILDLYFMDARSKLIDIAAFLDRVERHEGDADFRAEAFCKAMEAMANPEGRTRAQAVLESLSDHSVDPIEKAGMQGAVGAAAVSEGN